MVVSFAAVCRLLEKDLNCILNHEMRAEFFPLFSDGIKAAYTSFVPPYTLPKVLLIYILYLSIVKDFHFFSSFFFFSFRFYLELHLYDLKANWKQEASLIPYSVWSLFGVGDETKYETGYAMWQAETNALNRVFHPCFCKWVYSNPDALTTVTPLPWRYMTPKLVMCWSGSPII